MLCAYAQYINVNIEDPMFHETSLDFDDDSSPSSPLSVALVTTPDSQHDSDPVDCGFCFLFLHEASFDDVILPVSFHDSSRMNLVKTKNLVCFQERERERVTKDFGNPEKA